MTAKPTELLVKRPLYYSVPWEEAYGYAQAVVAGDQIYISGQLSHDAAGALSGPRRWTRMAR